VVHQKALLQQQQNTTSNNNKSVVIMMISKILQLPLAGNVSVGFAMQSVDRWELDMALEFFLRCHQCHLPLEFIGRGHRL